MDTKGFAAMLNGREYGEEISRAERELANDNGLVVVFGASDDLCEFSGAIEDEIGCYNGGTISINKNGIVTQACDECDGCRLWKNHIASLKTIEAVWCEGEYSWTYKTEIPHETFDIMEDGEKYCRGIVFEISALKMEDNIHGQS